MGNAVLINLIDPFALTAPKPLPVRRELEILFAFRANNDFKQFFIKLHSFLQNLIVSNVGKGEKIRNFWHYPIILASFCQGMFIAHYLPPSIAPHVTHSPHRLAVLRGFFAFFCHLTVSFTHRSDLLFIWFLVKYFNRCRFLLQQLKGRALLLRNFTHWNSAAQSAR